MIKDRFPRLKGLVLDMDGVLWRDNEAIGNLPQIFETIRKLGLSFVLATNNSTKTVEAYQKKLRNFGVELEPWQILSSAVVCLAYFKENFPKHAQVYIIGAPSLVQSFKEEGFKVLDIDASKTADAVVVGLDKTVTYDKIRYASQLIRKGATFIATNTDLTFPVPGGLIPGAGTIVKAVEVASGIEPIVVGKPEAFLFEQALKLMGTLPEETLAIGDRLDTDILGAQNAGLLNALVLSGVTSIDEAKQSGLKIDIIAKDLWEVLHD